MRRSLLNKPNLLKSLRQALMLFTLLLLPTTAWGQITVAGNSPSQDGTITGTDITGSVTFASTGDNSGTLTLNNATINGTIVLDNTLLYLIVDIIGTNTIQATNSAVIRRTNNEKWSAIWFTSSTKTGSLTLENIGGNSDEGLLYYIEPNSIESNPIEPSIKTLTPKFEGNSGWSTATKAEIKALGLTVAGVTVTTGNNTDILDGDNTEKVSFTPAEGTNPATLTLDGATIDGNIIYSGTEDLTIAFSGTNSVSTSENYAIQYVGSGSELPNLAFSLTNGSTTGSFNISSENSVINGFYDVDFGNLNLASASAQGVYYDSSEYGHNMAGYGGNPSDLTITTEKYYPIWIYDPSLDLISHTQLTGESTITIGEGSVSFDGDHTITINNITNFNYDGNTMIVVGPSMEQLTVNLVGTSSVASGSTALSLWDTTPLTFTTDNSGSLTGYNIVPDGFNNGQISYENGLKLFYDVENSYKKSISTTGTYLKIGNNSISETNEYTFGEGTAYFNASSNTLTLTGATIGSEGTAASTNIQVYVDDFKVEISGTNTIYGNITYSGSNYQSSNIQINKVSNSESPTSLKVTNVEGFSNCTWGNDLHLSAHDNDGGVIDVHYKPNGDEAGKMETYYGGVIKDITFSTEASNVIWVAGNMVTGTGNVVGNGISSDSGTVHYDATTNTLTLNGASIYTNENDPSPLIVCNGDLTVNLVGNENYISFSGSYSTYVFKNNATTGALTFTSDGEDASLGITSECYEGTYKGLCDGFSTVNFNSDLGLFNRSGSKAIKNITDHAPVFNMSNGVCYWVTNEGILVNATYHYKIDYVDSSIEGSGVEVDLEADVTNGGFDGANFDSSDLLGPCTITAYAKLDGTIIGSNKAKLFGLADNTITLNSETPFNSVLTTDMLDIQPAIEEADGVNLTILTSHNPVVIQISEGEGTATIVGIGECNLEVKLNILETSNLTVLNSNNGEGVMFSTEVTVLPDKPSIVKDAEHDYIETDKITITRTALDGEEGDYVIFYTWNNACAIDEALEEGCAYFSYDENPDNAPLIYNPENLIAAQTGTLRAWVGYSAGDNLYYISEVVSEEFTVYELAEIGWETETQTYGAYYNPDKDMAVPSGSTAYIVTGISEDGTSVIISPVSYIKAGVAVLIERGKTTEVSKTTDFSASKMNYSDPENPAQPSSTDNWYVLYNNKFVKVTTGTEVKGGKCYLNLNATPAGTRGFYNIGNGEGTTAIREIISEGVNSEKLADGAWHDLQGRKFTTKPTKAGIYIRNGKKIVIK